MNRSTNDKQTYPKSALKQQIGAEVELGIALSADPVNANLPDLAIRITTINSPWFARTCRICKDKFREGDQVRLCPDCGEAFHDDNQYSLHCWPKKFADGAICTEGGPDRFNESSSGLPRCEFSCSSSFTDVGTSIPSSAMASSHNSPAALLVKQFVKGIETTWRPFGEQQSTKVERGSSMVGHKCPWCRFRVRVGDWVVACPCQRNCGTYFHQDVFRHLTCWNEWNGVEGNNFCPNIGAPYPEAAKDTQ
jgi:hypothetical protein